MTARRGRSTWMAVAVPMLTLACSSGSPGGVVPSLPRATVAIRGGLIVDGSGRPAFVGDLLVRGDSVLYVGPARVRGVGEPVADVEIDARGRLVTPGFVRVGDTAEASTDRADGVALHVPFAESSGDTDAAVAARSAHTLALVNAKTVRQREVGVTDDAPSASQLARMEDAVAQAIATGAAAVVIPRTSGRSPEATNANATLAAAARTAGGAVLIEMPNTPGRPFDDLADVLALAGRANGETMIADIGTGVRDAPDALAPLLAQVDSARTAGLDVVVSLAYAAQRDVAAAFEAPWVLVAGDPLPFLAAAQRREVRVSLEAAVARVTSAPAQRLGLGRRHCLAAGCAADIVVLDTVGLERAGLTVRAALLDGVPTWLEGARTAARPARIMRRLPARSPRPPS